MLTDGTSGTHTDQSGLTRLNEPGTARPGSGAGAVGWFAAALLVVYILITRLYRLDEKVMHHDESLFAYYGYWLYSGNGYDYQPILHGPVLQYLSAIFFFFFDDTQFTMRLPAALGGLGLFGVLYLWRGYLGRYGVWAAVLALALSPSITYYSRFLRNDVPYLAVTMLCAWLLVRLFQTGARKYAWGSVIAATIMFSMMESSIFFYAACLGYVTTMLLADGVWSLFRQPTVHSWPTELGADRPNRDGLSLRGYLKAALFGVAVGALTAWLYKRIILDTVPIGRGAYSYFINWAAAYLWCAVCTVASLAFYRAYWLGRSPAGIARRVAEVFYVNRWYVLASLVAGVGIYTTLFTTFFTHTRDISFDHTARTFAGPEKALTPVQIYKNTWDYWWDQHKLHRIKGPFHYYYPLLLMYELPLVLLAVFGWLRVLRRRYFTAALIVVMHVALAMVLGLAERRNWIDWEVWDAKFHVTHEFHVHLALMYAQILLIVVPLLYRRGRRVESFVTYWTITAIFAYSYAGEKVPWLTVHVAGPLCLLAGFQVQYLVERFLPAGRAKRLLFTAVAVFAILHQVRNQHMLQFVNPSNPAERLVYNHTSPDIHRALEDIEEIAEKTNFGNRLPIYMDGEMGWPLHWYLREYTNVATTGENPGSTTRPLVLLNWYDAATTNIQENYVVQRMKVREWWEPPTLQPAVMADIYLALAPREALRGSTTGERLNLSKLEWKKLLHYLAYRKIWLDPANRDWSNGANEFAFCLRKDFLTTAMTYNWLGGTPRRTDIPVYYPPF